MSTTENKHLSHSLANVLKFYHQSPNTCTVTPIGNGLINKTYLVNTPERKFVLQCINTHVFPTPADVVHNAELIHQHLLQKIQSNTYPLQSIGLINNVNNNTLTYCDGNYWRALTYIENTITIEHIENTQQAEQVAHAFAQFSVNLSDINTANLIDTIPQFHHLTTRLKQFNTALNKATSTNKTQSNALISFIHSHQSFIDKVNNISKHLPIRVTHNDTKINNLLFCKQTHRATAVIDLDTCMPGFLMNDFGDLIRTCCPNIDENNTDLPSMNIRMELFEAITKGYIKAFNNTLTTLEKESLVVGCLLIPFMLAVRFLTDHLNGNVYFNTQYPKQNLDRAKNQFHLFSLLYKKQHELLNIIMHA